MTTVLQVSLACTHAKKKETEWRALLWLRRCSGHGPFSLLLLGSLRPGRGNLVHKETHRIFSRPSLRYYVFIELSSNVSLLFVFCFSFLHRQFFDINMHLYIFPLKFIDFCIFLY